MLDFPNAKINIGLNVIQKREDGYHDIETLFYPIGLKDVLECVQAEDTQEDELQFKVTGGGLDNDEMENLCVRSWNLVHQRYSLPKTRMHLHKLIPIGAGLGGGSSDAAFTIQILDKVFNLKISDKEKLALATEIGSDCAFFIYNKPALAMGRGEILKVVDTALESFYIVLVHPGVHISTADAYGGITPKPPKIKLEEALQKPITDWKKLIVNDFEESVFSKYPKIGKIKEELYNFGAVYASMTGSGSAVYGIFNKRVKLKNKFPSFYVYEGWL
jgi:4-diphosphocytidyl-2-C-methyl-D-erythritol kinase